MRSTISTIALTWWWSDGMVRVKYSKRCLLLSSGLVEKNETWGWYEISSGTVSHSKSKNGTLERGRQYKNNVTWFRKYNTVGRLISVNGTHRVRVIAAVSPLATIRRYTLRDEGHKFSRVVLYVTCTSPLATWKLLFRTIYTLWCTTCDLIKSFMSSDAHRLEWHCHTLHQMGLQFVRCTGPGPNRHTTHTHVSEMSCPKAISFTNETWAITKCAKHSFLYAVRRDAENFHFQFNISHCVCVCVDKSPL